MLNLETAHLEVRLLRPAVVAAAAGAAAAALLRRLLLHRHGLHGGPGARALRGLAGGPPVGAGAGGWHRLILAVRDAGAARVAVAIGGVVRAAAVRRVHAPVAAAVLRVLPGAALQHSAAAVPGRLPVKIADALPRRRSVHRLCVMRVASLDIHTD